MEYGYFKRRDRDDRGDSRDRDRGNDRGFDRGNDRGGFDRGRGGFRERGENRDFRDRDAEESVFSKRVRAGKRRTYFFDVRKTRGNDFFITITESTRRDEGFGYRRHKIFLYKEDFNRFVASLNEVVDHVKTDLMPEFDYEEFDRRQAEWEAQNRDAEEGDGFDDTADKDVEFPSNEEEGGEDKPINEDEVNW